MWQPKGRLGKRTMVIIKEVALPPMKWNLGRINNVYSGVDGVSRVADIRTNKGLITRAFYRISPFPLHNGPLESQNFQSRLKTVTRPPKGEAPPPRRTRLRPIKLPAIFVLFFLRIRRWTRIFIVLLNVLQWRNTINHLRTYHHRIASPHSLQFTKIEVIA